MVEITAVFQVDCMIAGVVPHPLPAHLNPLSPPHSRLSSSSSTSNPPPLTSLLILAYTPPDTSLLNTESERTEDRIQQKRKAAFRPELRIISRQGEELTADAVGVTDFERWGCNDYALVNPATGEEGWYVVMSPRDVVLVKPRDARDHVAWLVERRKYEEALEAIEAIGSATPEETTEIGLRYVEHLVAEGQPFHFSFHSGADLVWSGVGDYEKAAKLCPKVCAGDAKRWEDWIWAFAQKKQLHVRLLHSRISRPDADALIR